MMLCSGLDGIKNNLPTPPATNVDIFEMSAAEKVEAGIASLPANLHEALQELKVNPIARQALGDHILEKYLEGKQKEWDAFRTAVTDWEVENYLSKYDDGPAIMSRRALIRDALFLPRSRNLLISALPPAMASGDQLLIIFL
jgi:hypothetical protein